MSLKSKLLSETFSIQDAIPIMNNHFFYVLPINSYVFCMFLGSTYHKYHLSDSVIFAVKTESKLYSFKE